MKRRNVTLSIPEDVLQKLRVIAAKRNLSMSHLITDAVGRIVDEDPEYELRKKRFLDMLANPLDLGTGGNITWTRDELHERVHRH